MFFFGDDYWGKVDWVPGLFYVKTRFVHVWWFPILPRESWLFRDENPPPAIPRGIRVPLRWKSVFLAWLQSFLLIAILILLFGGGALMTVDPQDMNVHPIVLGLFLWAIALSFAFLYWRSCQWMSPTLARAIELGERLGMSPEDVEIQFKIAR